MNIDSVKLGDHKNFDPVCTCILPYTFSDQQGLVVYIAAYTSAKQHGFRFSAI